MSKQVHLLKTNVVQVRKREKILRNENINLLEKITDLKTMLKKKTIRNNNGRRQLNSVKNTIAEQTQDIEEIMVFKNSLLEELKSEEILKNEIHIIANKYKKLIADQRREKEKIQQMVVH